MKRYTLFAIFILITSLASAETIKLKTGSLIEGKLVEKTDEYIKLDVSGVTVTFYNDEIENVVDANILDNSIKRQQQTDAAAAGKRQGKVKGVRADGWIEIEVVPRIPIGDQSTLEACRRIAEEGSLSAKVDAHKCMKKIALETLSVDICETMVTGKIGLSSVQFECFKEIALALNDASICERTYPTFAGQVHDCYRYFAVSKRDSSFCPEKNMKYYVDRGECLVKASIAEQYPQVSLEELRGSRPAYWFIKEVSNPDLCNLYESDQLKKECLQQMK